jgi:hypothetical protein
MHNGLAFNARLASSLFARSTGHRDSAWMLQILQQMKDIDDEEGVTAAFANTNDPRGLLIAALRNFDFQHPTRYRKIQKAAAAEYAWAYQVLGSYYRDGVFVAQNVGTYVSYLEKGALVNNPSCLHWLGEYYYNLNDLPKARKCFLEGAKLGWVDSMNRMAEFCYYGLGGERDLKAVIYYGGKVYLSDSFHFDRIFGNILTWKKAGAPEYDVYLAYELGRALYFDVYHESLFKYNQKYSGGFAEKCLDFYCDNIDLTQSAIVTFLAFWKQRGMNRDVGILIGKMVWSQRDVLLISKINPV